MTIVLYVVALLQVVLCCTALFVIYRWNKKAQPVRCEVLDRKLYKVGGRFSGATVLSSAYPLWVYKVMNPINDSIRYISVNGVTNVRFSKDKYLNLYTSPSGSVLFDKVVGKSTKVALFLNIFGYMVGMGVCYGISNLIFWLLGSCFSLNLGQALESGIHLGYVLTILLFEIKYILMDFCLWDLKLKLRYNRIKDVSTTDILNKALK